MATVSTDTSERLEARISSSQKQLFKEAASLRGVTLTDFVVSSAYEAAVRTLEAGKVIELTRRDQQAFVQALLTPAAPNAELRRAWARHATSPPRRQRTRGTKRAR